MLTPWPKLRVLPAGPPSMDRWLNGPSPPCENGPIYRCTSGMQICTFQGEQGPILKGARAREPVISGQDRSYEPVQCRDVTYCEDASWESE